jgi:hypothetical protein
MDIVNKYAALMNLSVKIDNENDIYYLMVGNYYASSENEDKLYDEFIEKYNIHNAIFKLEAFDFVYYGKTYILPYIHIRLNDESFFEQKHTILTTDSEGHYPNQYPQIIQFATSDTNVYIFNVDKYKQEILDILKDQNILKVVFDLNSEERVFKIKYNNVIDLQKNGISFVKLIYDKFNIKLKKNKRIHFNGWDANNLTEQQINYSAFDVIWMYHLYIQGIQ